MGILRIEDLIDSIEDQGCDCDHIYGYQCSIHKDIRELKRLINDYILPPLKRRKKADPND